MASFITCISEAESMTCFLSAIFQLRESSFFSAARNCLPSASGAPFKPANGLKQPTPTTTQSKLIAKNQRKTACEGRLCIVHMLAHSVSILTRYCLLSTVRGGSTSPRYEASRLTPTALSQTTGTDTLCLGRPPPGDVFRRCFVSSTRPLYAVSRVVTLQSGFPLI